MNSRQYQMKLPDWRRIAGGSSACPVWCRFIGCKSSSRAPGAGGPDASQPIALRAAGQPSGSSVMIPVNEAQAHRAIENYRINKSRKKGPYQMKGVDLDGDGVGEALVLFGGEDWCTKAGCSLAVLKSNERGYEPVFRTVRVKAPVIIGRDGNQGWRDLIVMTGSGNTPRRVLLRFTGSGYPRNAMQEPVIPSGAPVDGEIAIAGGPGTGTALQ